MDEASYLVDVRPILEDLGARIALDAEVELPDVCVGTETFRPLGPSRLDAGLTNTGAGIVLEGTLHATLEAVCSRCLREFPLEIAVQLEGFYVLPGHDDEIPEEQEVSFIKEGFVDVMDQILTTLALELPFAPVHAEDCPGICPECGADLSEGPCGCEPGVSDSPFAGLKDLLSSGDEE